MTAAEIVVAPSLRENEEIIERGMASFMEVGRALQTIRDERQYSEAGFGSFEQYCKTRWDMGRHNANKTIGAAGVVRTLTTQGLPAPQSVRAADALVRVLNAAGQYDNQTGELRKPERGEQAVIRTWKTVIAKHGDSDKPITARDVQQVISPPASSGGPVGWAEMLGVTADLLIKAEKQLDKLEAAIDGKESKWPERLREKAGRYRQMAESLAARYAELQELGT